jgi:hypothetical protein
MNGRKKNTKYSVRRSEKPEKKVRDKNNQVLSKPELKPQQLTQKNSDTPVDQKKIRDKGIS